MSIQRNLNDGNVKDILRRLYRLERQSMLSHSSIGREGLEVYDGGWIRILNGGLQVIGTATISGVLDVTGTFNASGVNNLSGENHLTGPTDVAGNFEIIAGGLFKAGTVEIRPDGSADFGTLNIESDGTLNVHNDVNVLTGGIINVGTNMQLTPSDDGGAMVFQDGSKVSSVAGTVQVKSSSPGVGLTAGLNTASIGAGPTGATMSVDDAGDWVIQGTRVTIQSIGDTADLNGSLDISNKLTAAGSVKFTGLQVQLTGIPTTANQPNVHISGTGYLYRSTWTPA
ncbi:hypothetical protein RN04_03575 [Arthrobacter sp. W1]|nr:hypothetical protein RN04_03575 [Arthrobacter sp. W1]